MTTANPWGIGYEPLEVVRALGTFTRKPDAEAVARMVNRQPGPLRGRGLKAVRVDASGRRVR